MIRKYMIIGFSLLISTVAVNFQVDIQSLIYQLMYVVKIDTVSFVMIGWLIALLFGIGLFFRMIVRISKQDFCTSASIIMAILVAFFILAQLTHISLILSDVNVEYGWENVLIKDKIYLVFLLYTVTQMLITYVSIKQKIEKV